MDTTTIHSDRYTIQRMSERTRIILCMIDENTDVERDGEFIKEVYQYFQGGIARNIYVSFQKDPIFIWERRDGRIIHALLIKRFIEQPFQAEPKGFITTEEGHTFAQRLLPLVSKDN